MKHFTLGIGLVLAALGLTAGSAKPARAGMIMRMTNGETGRNGQINDLGMLVDSFEVMTNGSGSVSAGLTLASASNSLTSTPFSYGLTTSTLSIATSASANITVALNSTK